MLVHCGALRKPEFEAFIASLACSRAVRELQVCESNADQHAPWAADLRRHRDALRKAIVDMSFYPSFRLERRGQYNPDRSAGVYRSLRPRISPFRVAAQAGARLSNPPPAEISDESLISMLL